MIVPGADSGTPAHFPALRFEVDARDAESWTDALLDAGALCVDLSDPHAGSAGETALYGEPGVAETALWPVSLIEALFAAGSDIDAAIGDAAAAIGRSPPRFARHSVAELDWLRETQRQFAPISIDEGLWIVPSWCEAPDPAAINLALDPGLAFGTGSHPTTRLCLEWMRAGGVGGVSLLDYGCGSGILAIAAAKLGAREVAGTDVDPQAIRASRANARDNGVAVRFAQPDALAPGCFDIVVANILANPLILLAPLLAQRVSVGGHIVLAGILDAQQDAVVDAYRRWITLAPWRHADGWVLLHGERRE